MRLIRLTTTNTNGQIDTFFNENIHIKPFSQIALGNVSLDSITDSIKIDGTNNKVEFQFKTGTVRTVHLETGIYTSNNYKVLLEDIAHKINNALSATGDAGERGKQVQVSIDTGGKVQINIGNGGYAMYGTNLESNITKTSAGVDLLEITGGKDIISDTQNISTTTYNRASFYSNTLCKGAGVYRAKISKLVDTGEANNLQGGAIWVMNKNPNTLKDTNGNLRPPVVGDILCGVRFEKTGDPYKMIINGVETAVDNGRNVAVFGSAHVNNDHVGIEINEGGLELVVYYDNAGTVERHILNTTTPLNFDSSTTDLWVGLSIMSKKDANSNTRLSSVKFNRNPFEKPVVNADLDDGDLGFVPIGGADITTSTPHYIEFQSQSIIEYLGFTTTRLPPLGFIVASSVIFTASNTFNATDTSDAFLIEMMNIPIESYDGLPSQGQRKNLLAVVAKSDVFGYVIYEPSNLLFLDMNNKQPLILNNIKARILKQDYSEMFIQGTTTLTIYIKDPSEK
tara:strand:+ start:385 stop:1914 length:1530 start_codon:yes stop_codon:yes gene_type:complete